MLRFLTAVGLPFVLLGQVTHLEHLLLQMQHRRTRDPSPESESTSAFESVDGGEGRVCRGADARDRGTAGNEYILFTGSTSLDDCKRHCLDTSACRGIEYRSGRCEVWTRPGGITSAGGKGYECLRLRRESLPFMPADGGADRACRGADSQDKGAAGIDYIFFAGTVTLDECKSHCIDTAGCRGIEYKPGHCEVWTRTSGIGATAKVPGYTCLRYSGAGGSATTATTTTTTLTTGEWAFMPVGGGSDRACRGSGPRDAGQAGEDYKLFRSTDSLEECKAHCMALGAPACKGIEYSTGRCEVWTRTGGIGNSARVNNFTCLRYVPTSGPDQCGEFGPVQDDRDLAGSLMAALHSKSPAHCCSACTAANGCEGFAYIEQLEECYLKANVTGTYVNPGVVTQVKYTPAGEMPTCSGYGEWQVDRDVAGVELDQAHAISAEYCCAACDLANDCQGFSYLPELEMCYLKTNVTGTYAHPGRVSQLRPLQTTPPPTARPGSCDGYGTLMRDTDVGGMLLAHVLVQTVDECCGACDQAHGCEGYAFLEEFKTCYLKANVTGTYPKEGPVARLKRHLGMPDPSTHPRCEGYQDAMNDTDVRGRLLGEVPAYSPSHCCGACEEITACEGFTFCEQTQVCYLKADVTGTYPNPGRVSRIKPKLASTTPALADLPTCMGYHAAQLDLDLAGRLLSEVHADSAEICCAACAEVHGCEGFSYLGEYKMCYLKAEVLGTYSKPGCVARMRSRLPSRAPEPEPEPEPEPAACGTFGSLQEGTDLVGLTLAETHATSADRCCGLCDSTDHCEGFSYLEEFQTCYLKAFLSGTYAKEGCVARRRPQAASPREDPAVSCLGYGDLLEDADLAGVEIAAVYSKDPTRCCLACTERSDCQGFAFLDEYRQCYLKTNVTGTFEKTDCLTRLRLP